MIVDLLKEIPVKVQYIIVNEAGASVYSASKLATEEFPNFDVGQRSAASMARRLQDPLAELVKIDPKSIGVGQYQHDMNQKKLSEALSGVVEDCVNKVGVDLNTASASLLEYISGISKVIAKNIVAYREENGRFGSRNQLLKVAKLGPKAYEQCAGFMRITDGKNPLDATGVHPESYDATKKLLDKLGFTMEDVKNRNLDGISKKISNYDKLAEELGMDALVEAHDEEEAERALKSGARIIGVNNRDLKTFQVDMQNSIRLRKLAPENVVFVSESGIKTSDDIQKLYDNQVDAVLIGETLMRSQDKKAALEELNGKPLK